MKIKASNYRYRLLARFVVEAQTPLAIGSGEKDILTDALVALDVNGLPYIPATSIAGVVRSMIEVDRNLFGYQDRDKGRGSEITFTEGKILNSKGEVIDGMVESIDDDTLLKAYSTLPIRQHVRINDKGTAEKAGKFDEQVVFAGTRFAFEVEIVSASDNLDNLAKVMGALDDQSFRLGSGSRSGFGKVEIVASQTVCLNLYDSSDMQLYQEKSSQLQASASWAGWKKHTETKKKEDDTEEWTIYNLTLRPDDFFLFGSGHGDADGDADMTAVRETKIKWKNGVGSLQESCVLIPASSLKGALRHRVAYHYNKKLEHYVDNGTAQEAKDCKVVKDLFGSADGENITRGNVLFHDIIKAEGAVIPKLVNHVSIDRFSGGSIDGALFTEQDDFGKGSEFETTIMVKSGVLKDENNRYAWEEALKDVIAGMLPLGGGVNRGNGIFSGTITNENGEELKWK